MRRNTVVTFALLVVAFAFSGTAFAQKATVLRVIIVKTDNLAGYLQELQKGQALLKGLVDSDSKTSASSEYKDWLKSLDKIRKIVSDSLYTEQ